MEKTIGMYNRRFRSVLSFAVALSLIGLVCYLGIKTYQSSHAAFGPSMYVSPGAGTVANGSTLSVTIREQSGDEKINSVQSTLNYDTATLQFVSIAEGGVFGVASITNTSTPGVIRIARASTDADARGDKPIVTINFKVIGSSGTSTIGLDKASSFLRRSFDGRDILETLGGGNFAVVPISTDPSSVAAPTLYINPSSGTYAAGATIAASVRLSAHSTPVTTVEAVISYPKTRLQFMGVSEGGIFTTKQRTNDVGGVVDVIRAVPAGSSGVQGDNPVVKVMFKTIGSSGSVPLSITAASAAFDSSGSGTNILDLAGSDSAEYAVSSPVSYISGTTTTITSPSQAVTVTTKGASGRVALTPAIDGSTLVEIGGQVVLTPIIDPVVAKNADDKVSKIEYYIGGKLIASKQAAPYSFTFDSRMMRNGTYALVVKTYYSSGNTGSRSDKLLIKNQITIGYIVHHYLAHIVALVITLVVLVTVIVTVVIPRLSDAPDDDALVDEVGSHGLETGKVTEITVPTVDVAAVVVGSTIARPTAYAASSPVRSVDGIIDLSRKSGSARDPYLFTTLSDLSNCAK